MVFCGVLFQGTITTPILIQTLTGEKKTPKSINILILEGTEKHSPKRSVGGALHLAYRSSEFLRQQGGRNEVPS